MALLAGDLLQAQFGLTHVFGQGFVARACRNQQTQEVFAGLGAFFAEGVEDGFAELVHKGWVVGQAAQDQRTKFHGGLGYVLLQAR